MLSGTAALPEDELKKIDQLLYAILVGIYNENASTGARSHARVAHDFGSKPNLALIIDDVVVRKVGNQIRAGFAGLLGSLQSLADSAGGNLAEPVSWGLGALQGVLDVLVVGATNELVNYLRDEMGDSYRPGEGVMDAATEAAEAFIKSKMPRWLEEAADIYAKLRKAEKARIKKICSQGPLSEKQRQICLEWDVHPEAFSYVRHARFIAAKEVGYGKTIHVVTSGQPVTLDYFIGGWTGHKHAKINTVIIDWDTETDDGNVTTEVFNSGYPDVSAFGGKRSSHTYILPSLEDKIYTASVTVVGDNDSGASRSHTITSSILVKTDTDPFSVAFTTGSKVLQVNENGRWKVEISGGVAPFDMELYWKSVGREIPFPLSREDSYARKYSIGHKYLEEDAYTIEYDVTDAKGDMASATYLVYVGGQDSEYLELDKVEYYSYKNDCEGSNACITSEWSGGRYSGQAYYDIEIGKAKYTYEQYDWGTLESSFHLDFTFDSPPAIIKKGSVIPMSMAGGGGGFTEGMFLSRGIWYSTRMSLTAWTQVVYEGRLKIENREMPNYDSGVFHGTISGRSSVSNIEIPENAADGFMIGVKHGWDPGMYITWTCKTYGAE